MLIPHTDILFSVYQKGTMGSLFQHDAGAEMRKHYPGRTMQCMQTPTLRLYSPMHTRKSKFHVLKMSKKFSEPSCCKEKPVNFTHLEIEKKLESMD